jgi:uncharacterized membrane protein
MIPGTTTKLSESTVASAATIEAKSDLLRVTGTTSIATIRPHFGGGFSGILFLVPIDGNVATTTTGNVGVAVTMLQSKVTVLVYSKTDGKWYTHALS